MERKNSPTFCSDCPLIKLIPEVKAAVVEGEAPEIRAEDITVASDTRKVKAPITPERRQSAQPLLSKVFVIFSSITESNLSDVPPGSKVRMPTKSFIRNRKLVQGWIRRKFKKCSEPQNGVCPAVTLIGLPRLSQQPNK